MENQNTQILTDKIARLLQTETQNSNFNSLHSSLEKLAQRLEIIEVKLNNQNSPANTKILNANHTSQEKFLNLEELADETLNGLTDEKACPYEPTGKPCDHCAMCNSRGF